MTSPSPDELQARAARAGLNLCGLVDAQRFDRCQPPDWRAQRLLPDCGTVVVLGSGGRGFWQQLQQEHGVLRPPAPNYHPLQQHASRCVQQLLDWLAAEGLRPLPVQPHERATLNFVQLAEAAGIGVVSPVAQLLLHPTFGAWISLRAALLFPGRPFGSIADRSLHDTWQPCLHCPRPCVAACPAGVHDGRGGSDLRRCAEHRHAGHCADSCSARAACPIGSEHRFGADEEAHRQAYATAAMRRQYGLGPWRFVPRGWRC